MDRLYRFSPITDEQALQIVLNYLTGELKKLSEKLLQEQLPITTLKVFPHYPEEYEYLHSLISSMGPKTSFSSETSLYVKVDKKINGFGIKYLGVRIVDPYRMQVGCGDYEIENFAEFREKHRNKAPFVRDVQGEMIELWHPDVDVLGYVVPVL